MEAEWGNFEYVVLAYLVPVNCVIGFCENLIILYVLYHMKTGVGESSRMYYALLAIFNFSILLVMHLTNGFITNGLHFATQGKFYLSEPIHNLWFCKIYINLYIFVDVLVMWTYVLLNIDRTVAISAPLKAKSMFTVRRNLQYVAIVGAFGFVLMLYSMEVHTIAYTLDLLGPLACVPGSPSLTNMIFYEFITNAGIFTLPPALSLLLGIILLVSIRRQMAARAHLLKGTSRSNATPTSSATTGAVVVITMAIVHAAVNLPAGIFGCLFYMYVFCTYTVCKFTLQFTYTNYLLCFIKKIT